MRRVVLVSVLGALLALVAIGHRFALRDLRQIEADYVASREPTACAIQELSPLALGPETTPRQFDRRLLKLVQDAAAEVEALRRELETRGAPFPYPRVRSARAALSDALAGQVRLYDVMVRDPERADEALRRFAAVNGRAAERISSARRALLVSAGAGWSRRFVCDKSPPKIPPP